MPRAKTISASAAPLAIEGGAPVRREPLPGAYPGALLIGDAEEREILDVLRARSPFRYYGPAVQGKTAAFERGLAARLGVGHVLGVNSGTAALKCALFAAGVRAGDEVLVPACSYVATADVVLSLGATPVFVEVDDSLTMDPGDLARKIGPRARAVTPVHLFGVSAALDPILGIARAAGLRVVEDCSQALGAEYRGQPVGTFGDAGITSFQINKVITAGEGGALFTNDPSLMARAVRLHDHGNYRDDETAGEPLVGEGMRMSELHGAVLVAQLSRLDRILAALRTAKRFLIDALSGVAGITLARIPDPAGDAGCSLVLFAKDAARCARLVDAVNREGVRVTRVYGGRALYDHPAVRAAIVRRPACPGSEALTARAVALGLASTFTPRDLEDIVEAIAKVARAIER